MDDTRYAIVDFETNSLSTNDPIEVAVVHIESSGPRVVFESLIKPPRRIANRDVHGISNRDVRNAPTIEEIFPTLLPFIRNRILVAHNAKFDSRILDDVLERSGWQRGIPWICTMELGAFITGERLKLTELATKLGIELPSVLHRAGPDAMLTARAFEKLLADPTVLNAVAFLPEPCWERDEFELYLSALRLGNTPEISLAETELVRAHLVFANEVITQLLEAQRFDSDSTTQLARVFEKLESLGWKPGEVL